MAARGKRFRRALELTRVARRTHLVRILREVGVVGERTATREHAVRFRKGLEELGTTYVKLGQLLSSRPDLLPDVYIDELGKLVDDVPALPYAQLEPIVAEEIGLEHFSHIDPEPLATASIAQIHRALMRSGREVVIKIRRPGIVEQVDVDLSLLKKTAAVAEGRSEAARLLQLNALVDELENHLHGELDFHGEAHNSELIAAIVAEYSEDLIVPQVIHPHVSERVLVLEEIKGVKVSEQHGLEPERAAHLARAFFRSYVRQVTVTGLYHADPHRGNVLVTEDGRLALLDFGLLGRLDDDTRASLALLLLAIAQNRADDVADLILSLSLTTFDSEEAAFVHDLRRTLPRYHWRPLSGIRVGGGLADLQRLCLTHGIALPTSFALVGKTLSQAEEIARLLDPLMDPVELLRSEGRSVMAEEVQRRLEPNQLLAFSFTQLQPLLRMPRKMAQLVTRLEEGTLKVGIAPTGLDDIEQVLRSVSNRLGAAMIVVGLLVSSALMARVNHTLSLVGFLLAAAGGVYMMWRIFRTPGGL